ncbi:hypothetical protein NAT51_17005 [Flavobacterium amniphilum]|uniref:DUF5074 domain-containing protein n=1 Tax=Flavobacterium amniphilum TaxID=1834035 RepID=UPI00202A0C68|nr:DUF5074 domain-containing protein [Flavobacterium amniphilum]MCL9807233.1 hypothetical protein [Flavobacterium amniphilum]
MKSIGKLFITVASLSLFFVSCSDDSDSGQKPLGDYEKGFFVLNEGNSNPSTASVTFIGDNGAIEQNVFGNVNPNEIGMGSYLQSMFFAGDKAFIISGSANKVTVVDRYTFKYLASVTTNLENPRYGALVNGKIYITNYADYSTGADDFLTVVDPLNYSTTKILLNNWSERVLEHNGKLYIANGYYGSGNSVTVFNTTTGTADKVINLGTSNSPNSMEVKDGILYVLASNDSDQGTIFRINLTTNEVVSSVEVPAEIENPKQLDIENDKIYFTAGTSVYNLGINATSVATTPVMSYSSTSAWGQMYGFKIQNGKIYIADGGDFASDSKVYQYSAAGSLLNTYTVGVGPNGFYFQ